MKKLVLLLILLLPIVGLPALVLLAIDEGPTRAGSVQLRPEDIDRAKAVLNRNDPRGLEPGEIATRWIDESELSLAVGYALSQLTAGGAAIRMHPGRAYADFSVALPAQYGDYWINGNFVLLQQGDSLVLDSLTLGQVTIPGWFMEGIRDFANSQLKRIPEYAAAVGALNGLQLIEDRMLVVFQWRPELLDSLKSRGQDMVIDDATRERLLAYSRQIQVAASRPGMPEEVSLVEVMAPVLSLAQARSGDPVEENRAALLALAFYFGGVSIDRMLGVELPDRGGVDKRMTLSGRYDFAQHFLTSAALTVAGNGQLADFVGLFKELDDAGGGSGFSFTDLGADRAGVRFAEYAVSNADNARRLQNMLGGSAREAQFFPEFKDLPEFMPADEFQSRFGGVGAPAYQEVLADIETRLDGVPLFN